MFEAGHHREKEETGYNTVKIEQLPEVFTVVVNTKKENYQVHLILTVCKIKSGKFKSADAETCGHGWFTCKEALKMDMLPLNKKVIQYFCGDGYGDGVFRNYVSVCFHHSAFSSDSGCGSGRNFFYCY